MEAGEKYLTIQVLGQLKLVAFNNKKGREDNKHAPHFKGDGVAVWINEKKAKQDEDYCERLLG